MNRVASSVLVRYVLLGCFVLVLAAPQIASADVDTLIYWIKHTQYYAQKVYTASTLKNAHSYARNAKSAAEKAGKQAAQLQREFTAMYIRDAYYYAYQAEKAYDLEHAKSYAKIALRAAENARLSAARGQ